MNDALEFSFSDGPAWRAQLGRLIVSFVLIGLAALTTYALVIEPDLLPLETGALAPWVPGAVTAAAWIAAGVAVSVPAYRHYEWHYSIVEGTILSRRGIIGRSTRAISLADVRNVNVEQTLFERLLGIGNVEFSSAGGGDIEVVFSGVRRPVELAEAVQRLRVSVAGRAQD